MLKKIHVEITNYQNIIICYENSGLLFKVAQSDGYEWDQEAFVMRIVAYYLKLHSPMALSGVKRHLL